MNKKISVLLVEDDLNDVERVRRAFSTVTPNIFGLHHVPRFLDAIQVLKKERFHVILLDLGLPDSVGLTGVERLMSMVPAIPVIVLTGLNDEEASLAGIALGAQEFLDKGEVTTKVLIRTIRRAIKRKECSIDRPVVAADIDQSKLTELAEAVRLSTADVSTQAANLRETELSEHQQKLIASIEEASKRSGEIADRLAPPIDVMFVEAEPVPPDESHK